MTTSFYNSDVWADTKHLLLLFGATLAPEIIVNTYAQYILNPVTRHESWRMPLWPWSKYPFRFRWYYAVAIIEIFLFSTAFKYVVTHELGTVVTGPVNWPWWYHPISIFFCWLWYSILQYWFHVVLHSDYLWNMFHQYHHHYVHPRPFNDLAIHPGEYFLFNILCLYPQIFFIPIHEYAFIAYQIMIGIPGILEHSGTTVHIGKFWTAVDHEVHHTKYRVNYDTPLPIMDIIFGTYDGHWLGIEWGKPNLGFDIKQPEVDVSSFYSKVKSMGVLHQKDFRSIPGNTVDEISSYMKSKS